MAFCVTPTALGSVPWLQCESRRPPPNVTVGAGLCGQWRERMVKASMAVRVKPALTRLPVGSRGLEDCEGQVRTAIRGAKMGNLAESMWQEIHADPFRCRSK